MSEQFGLFTRAAAVFPFGRIRRKIDRAGVVKPDVLFCRIADAKLRQISDHRAVTDRVMFVQLKTGYDTDQGPCWISVVRFNRSWKTAYWHGKALRRWPGMFDANFYDVETNERYWISGPHRDLADTRYSRIQPTVDEDAREAYSAFLSGAPLPGRERG